MSDKTRSLAVVGATGLVGEAILSQLLECGFGPDEVHALGDEDEAGKRAEFGDAWLRVHDVEAFDFARVQVALFAAGTSVARFHALRAVDAGATVIDVDGAFADEAPLVVADVNPEVLARHRGIVACPHPAAAALAAVLAPIARAAGLARVDVCLLRPVSARGREGVEELARQTANLLNVRPIEPAVFERQVAFNVLGCTGAVDAGGWSVDERLLAEQTARVLGEDAAVINASAVTVPVFFGDALSVHLETRAPLAPEAARALLERVPGLELLDAADEADGGVTPVTDAAGSDAVFIGRVRAGAGGACALNLWVVADNVRSGAARNGVRIAERLLGA